MSMLTEKTSMPTDYENMLIVVGCVIGFVVLCLIVYVLWIRQTGSNKYASDVRAGAATSRAQSDPRHDRIFAGRFGVAKSDPRHDKTFMKRSSWIKSAPSQRWNQSDMSVSLESNSPQHSLVRSESSLPSNAYDLNDKEPKYYHEGRRISISERNKRELLDYRLDESYLLDESEE